MKARQITIDMQKPRMPEVTVVSQNLNRNDSRPEQKAVFETRNMEYKSPMVTPAVKTADIKQDALASAPKIVNIEAKSNDFVQSAEPKAMEPIDSVETTVIVEDTIPESPIKHLTAEEYVKNYLPKLTEAIKNDPYGAFTPTEEEKAYMSRSDFLKRDSVPKEEEKILQEEAKPAEKTVIAEEKKPETVKREYRIVGEVFNSYIIVEIEEKILLIDKHAAHERIIFEQLKKNMMSMDISSQLLMLPIEIMLMTDEVAAIDEYRAEIESVGFEFTCSRNTVSVTALPVGIEQDAVADMFAIMADRIKNGTGKVEITRNILFEKALYQASCKAAIKAGREYAKGHGDWVVNKLMELPDITFCPHGRPVAMELSKKNIDRQFERT